MTFEHMTAEEYQKEILGKCNNKSAKYKNKCIWYDGLYFQSQKELDDYLDHKRMLMAGEIAGFLWQGTLVLVEGGSTSKKRAVTYKPDVVTLFNDGTYEMREDKGKKTKDYIIKKKLILKKYPRVNFKEVWYMYFILAMLFTTLYIGFYFFIYGKKEKDFRKAKILFSLTLFFYATFIITIIVQK